LKLLKEEKRKRNRGRVIKRRGIGEAFEIALYRERDGSGWVGFRAFANPAQAG
jgi:hypothetical protein